MTKEQLLDALEPWVAIERGGSTHDGAYQQRERLRLIAELACQSFQGALVEIGCLNGSTTVQLAEVAQRYNRKVIAIDPWEIGTQNCEGGEYEIFMQSISSYQKIVEIIRARSDSTEAHKAVATRPLAFAFVDGLHTYEAAKNDIAMVQHAGLIAVDDLLWSAEVRHAFLEAVDLSERQAIGILEFREGYLL